MNDYEILYIVHPRLTADEVSGMAEQIGDMIRAQGGEVLSVDHWGRRRLAYPIQHQLEGAYVYSTFRMPAEGVVEFERSLRLTREVMRYLVLNEVLGEPGAAPPDDLGRGRREAPRPEEPRDEDRPQESAAEEPAAEAQPAEEQPAEAPAEAEPAEAPGEGEQAPDEQAEEPAAEPAVSNAG